MRPLKEAWTKLTCNSEAEEIVRFAQELAQVGGMLVTLHPAIGTAGMELAKEAAAAENCWDKIVNSAHGAKPPASLMDNK